MESCTLKPSRRPPSEDRSHSPLYEWSELSLLNTDCLLWPVPSTVAGVSQREVLLFQTKIKICLQLLHIFFFWAYRFLYRFLFWDIFVVLCCTKCRGGCQNRVHHEAVTKTFYKVGTSTGVLKAAGTVRCSVPMWLPSLHYCIRFILWLPNKQRRVKLSRDKCIVFLFGARSREEKKHFYSAENLTISRLAFCTLCYL